MKQKELRQHFTPRQDRTEQHLGAGGTRARRGTRTWQDEDVHEGLAVIQACRHDAVCPQPLGAQLVHFPAGGDGVAARHHPVVGGRRHHHPDPPDETADKSSQVQAGGHHGDEALVLQAGQKSRGKALAEEAAGLCEAGQDACCWDLPPAGSGRDWTLVGRGLRAHIGLPLPSSLPGRGQSCLQPHSAWEEQGGSPNFWQLIAGSWRRRRMRTGDAESPFQCSDDKTGYFIHVQTAWLLKIQARDKNRSGVLGLKTNDHTSVTSWKNKARNVVDRVTRETELIVSPEPPALLQ